MNKTTWILLFLAIISETIGTSVLKATNGFKNVVPPIMTASGYISAFFFCFLY
jgi:multidrug transporter EmrE-like cation transporter